MIDLYKIEGTTNIDAEQISGQEYNDPNYYPNFQKDIIDFKSTLINKLNNNEAYVVMRVYDGEFYFLDKQVVGNGPKRHFTKPLKDEFIKKFKDGCYKVDMLCVQLNKTMTDRFYKLFPDKNIDMPMDIIYGLFANKWFLNTFKNSIALIGGNYKLNIIKELMKYNEYREYINNDYFIDYIDVPERFSCDNVDDTIQDLKYKIEKSEAKVFLYGIGISKMAIAYNFKKFKNAIFIDVGCGLSALAGLCSNERPYFGSWINYRLKDYNYNLADSMDYNINKDKTIFL